MTFFLFNQCRFVRSSIPYRHLYFQSSRWLSTQTQNSSGFGQNNYEQTNNDQSTKDTQKRRRYRNYFLSIAAGALIGTLYTVRKSQSYEGLMPEYMSDPEYFERQAMEARPVPPPVTKRVTFDKPPKVNFPFKITLYQYITCPFSCKVRAYLNYNRIPYDIVEVNSVMRYETKWSIYKKVPVVVIEDEKVQLNDSSMIISAIESFVRIPTTSFRSISKLYQPVIERDQKGKFNFEYPNKYFLAEPLLTDRIDPTKQIQTEKSKNDSNFDQIKTVESKKATSKSFFGKIFGGSNSSADSNKQLDKVESSSNQDNQSKTIDKFKLERKWREWVDNKLVHTLSPNIYCTFSQSLNSFLWFSKVGNWEEIFPWYHRWIIVYVGAIMMRLVSGRLKKRHNLNDNVRLSLYECGNQWVKAVGNKEFLGGSEPNLADLNVYGALTSIQGCEAFDDLMKNTGIRPWFERMKALVESQSPNELQKIQI